jgi:hypothetical protein
MFVFEQETPALKRDQIATVMNMVPNTAMQQKRSGGIVCREVFTRMRPVGRAFRSSGNTRDGGGGRTWYPGVLFSIQQDRAGMRARIEWRGHLVDAPHFVFVLMYFRIAFYDCQKAHSGDQK